MVILSLLGIVSAHQPIMDMAPRWAGGWGFQFRYETLGSDKMLDGEFGNMDKSYYRQTTWLEGVYTWKRSIRATFKLPYHQIKSEKQLIDCSGSSALVDIAIAGDPLRQDLDLYRCFEVKVPIGQESLGKR